MQKPCITVFLAATAAASLFLAQAQQPAPATKAAAKGSVTGRLTWLDRQGKVIGTIGEPGTFRTLSVSPDGKQAAYERTDAQQNRDLWVWNAQGVETRLTSDPAWEAFPTWSPDGRRIIFTSNRSGQFDLYQKAANGSGEEDLVYKSPEGKGPTSWSPDGRFIIYYTLGAPTHVTLLPLAARQPTPIMDAQFSSITGRFSPDGKWIVYSSNESGRNEVSLRSFDPSTIGKPTVITTDGGSFPLWRNDGKEILYRSPAGMVMALEVNATTKAPTSAPKPLFKLPDAVLFWDISPDGTRFLMPVPAN